MEQSSNMEKVFQKLGELKTFFLYGQKLVPVLQKIIDFMRDTVPLLEHVNQSIQDSTSKIPKAALQLNNVTSATEVATTEILDVVDALSIDIQTMRTKLQSVKNHVSTQKEVITKLSTYVPANNGTGELVKKGLDTSLMDEDVESTLRLAEKIQEGMTNITLSLQVQDITAQQLSSVNHLIHSIQDKLSSLLTDLNTKEVKEVPVVSEIEIPKESAFNPDARYEKTHETQALVDSLVSKSNSKASQEEIDKLFAKQ